MNLDVIWTDFVHDDGQLCECSEMSSPLDGVRVLLEERPPVSERMAQILEAAGLTDDAGGRRSWTSRFELPVPDGGLSVTVSRFERDSTLAAAAQLIRLLGMYGRFAGEVSYQVICPPSQDSPPLLSCQIDAPEIGDVQVWAWADTLDGALGLLRRLVDVS